MTATDRLAEGLAAIARDRHDDARLALRDAAGGDALPASALLSRAMLTCLENDDANAVYDRPAAFEAFIRGGGNVPLYDATSAALAQLYGTCEVNSLLDIGCGDGMALIPALARTQHLPPCLDVVEPSEALLASAMEHLRSERRFRLDQLHAWSQTAQAFAAALQPDQRWDLAQSTFAVQSLPPAERRATWQRLRPHVRRLALVEFDVPALEPGSDAHYASLAQRYRLALEGYGDDAELIAGGFLAPMLLGQLRPDARPTNWEQPIAQWVEELRESGYALEFQRKLYDYSWSPAVLMVFA